MEQTCSFSLGHPVDHLENRDGTLNFKGQNIKEGKSLIKK